MLLLNCKTMTVGPCTNDTRDSRGMRRLRLKLDESGIGGSLAARREILKPRLHIRIEVTCVTLHQVGLPGTDVPVRLMYESAKNPLGTARVSPCAVAAD